MKSDRRVDIAIISVFAFVAALAMLTLVVPITPSLRVWVTVGAVLLGPGGLAYRTATGSRWAECLTVGAGVNVAILMLLGLFAVDAPFWHPIALELLIPATTLLLAVMLLRREKLIDRPGQSATVSVEPSWKVVMAALANWLGRRVT